MTAWADNAIGASTLAGRDKKPKEKVDGMPKKSRNSRRNSRVKTMPYREYEWKMGFCPHHQEKCRQCQHLVGKRVSVDWLKK